MQGIDLGQQAHVLVGIAEREAARGAHLPAQMALVEGAANQTGNLLAGIATDPAQIGGQESLVGPGQGRIAEVAAGSVQSTGNAQSGCGGKSPAGRPPPESQPPASMCVAV